jgi:5'-3' exonuclease
MPVWDGPGGSQKKRGIIKEYKLGRKPVRLNRQYEIGADEIEKNKIRQRKRLAEYLQDLPVYQVTVDNVEADDVIAHLVNKFEDEDVTIASGDNDFLQLLGPKTRIYKPKQRKFVTKKDLIEEHNVHPQNFALARAIDGDSSDNLKGVFGIGIPRLIKYVPMMTGEEEVTLEKFFAFCESQNDKKYQRFLDAKEVITRNYQVMQLYSPSISLQGIRKINDSLSKELRYNATSFRVKAMKQKMTGLRDDFMTSFLPMYHKGDSNGHG